MPQLWKLMGAAAIAIVPTTAEGQGPPPCDTRAAIGRHLAEKHGELPIAGGRTWSIIMTSPSGIACLVSAGEGWRWHGPKKGEPKA